MSAVFEPVRPGILHGRRPEAAPRAQVPPLENRLQAALATRRLAACSAAAFAPVLARVHVATDILRGVDDLERVRRRRALAGRGGGDAIDEAFVVDAFAHVALEIRAVFGFVPHDAQLHAAWAMLHGSLVEMATGEGKTIAAAITAIAVASSGTPVHVLTANDYLAARDADTLRPLYARFELGVAHVDERMDTASRTAAYRHDIVHAAARQVVFDHLLDGHEARVRDAGAGAGVSSTGRLAEALRPLVSTAPAAPARLRGLCFAIVDEADSVLIDEARTPLVLSEPAEDDDAGRARAAVALAIARALHEDVDYRVDADGRTVRLTPEGTRAVAVQTARLGGPWRLEHHRDELVRHALAALHVHRLDRDYLVRDDAVVLIDESTGRPTPERRLRHGLHQMIEMKERCSPTPRTEVAAATSFPRFLARYHRLAGTSGTLEEVRGELRETYRLAVTPVAPHRPCRLVRRPDTVAPDRDTQIEILLARIGACREAGRPVLVGTRTLALSERIAARLGEAGVDHRLLNARQDAAEAAVIADAGRACAVTIATNMAGRGADIPLDDAARTAGGLHVIDVELNDAARIDRQLFGRAARQGDPGSCERLLSLDDDTLASSVPPRPLALARRLADGDVARATRVGRVLFAVVRRRIERRHAHARSTLFHGTEHALRQIALGGARNP